MRWGNGNDRERGTTGDVITRGGKRREWTSSSRKRNQSKSKLWEEEKSHGLENWTLSFLRVVPEQSMFYSERLPQNETQTVPGINAEFPGFEGHKLGPSWYFNAFWKQGSCEYMAKAGRVMLYSLTSKISNLEECPLIMKWAALCAVLWLADISLNAKLYFTVESWHASHIKSLSCLSRCETNFVFMF